MRPIDKTPIHQYELITWKHPINPYKRVKVLELTEQQAHDINYAFALNRADKRYVRQD